MSKLTAEEVLNKYGTDKYNVTREDALAAMTEYAAQGQRGMRWVKVEDRVPSKFGMYVCIVEIVDDEDGLTYHPAAYCQYDTIRNEWTNPSVCYVAGEVVQWLDESPSPLPDDIVERLRGENPWLHDSDTETNAGLFHGWNKCCKRLQELLKQDK